MKAIVCDVRRALAGRWFWAALLATAAAGLLGLILYAVRGGGILLEINAEFNAALLRRMLCGGIWASVGCVMALATETSSAAHLGPLCLCYALMMLGKRFFPAAVMLNPINWIDGGDGMLAGLETVSILLQIVFLKRGVREYV